MIRAAVSIFRAGKPTFWLVRFSSGSMVDRKIPPSRVYLFRAAVSAIAFALYLAATLAVALVAVGPGHACAEARYAGAWAAERHWDRDVRSGEHGHDLRRPSLEQWDGEYHGAVCGQTY